jgi:anti-sigma B factor antagonist
VTGPDARRLDLEGEVTIATAAETHQQILALLASGPDLEIGLSGVTELDTAGLQVLLFARQEADRREVSLAFGAPSPAAEDVMAIAGLDAGWRPADADGVSHR